MKKAEIKVGGNYLAKVSGRLTTVRVDAIRDRDGYKRSETVYDVTNLATGRKTTFRSAAKFRAPAGADNVPKRKGDPKGEPAQVEVHHHTNGEVSVTVNPFSDDEDEQRPDPTPPSAQSTLSTNGRTGSGLPSASPARTVSSRLSSPVAAAAVPAGSLADKLRAASASVKAPPAAPHLEVQALAGTGKTTSAVEGLIEAKGGTPRITPSPQQRAIWDALKLGRLDTVRVSAFNTSITGEMARKLAEAGLDKQGVEAKGVHSLGYGAVQKALGRQQPSNYAVDDLVAQVIGVDPRTIRKQPGLANVVQSASKLVSLCKQTLTEPTPDDLDALRGHYDVEIDKESDRQRVYDLVPRVLDLCLSPKGTISFDDMVWLPVKLDLPIWKADLQIIDEAQDLNRMQQELVYRGGHRVVFIGDRNQAIYGFAGADAASMDRMSRTLNADVLPLTVTRRCGKAIVQEARQIVPSFEAHESNHAGLIGHMKYPTKNKVTGKEMSWEESYCAKVQPGDMLLCRVNAPLVSQCFRFLRRKIPAHILGRKIGEGLISLIDKSRASTIPDLIAWMSDWLAAETAKESAKRYPSELRLGALQDRHDCVVCFTEGLSDVGAVRMAIQEVFADKKCLRCGKSYDTADKACSVPSCRGEPLTLPAGVRLASIHKSKGLEAKRVFLLEPEGATVPHPMARKAWQIGQEWNLRYVAITRAIEELYYVS